MAASEPDTEPVKKGDRKRYRRVTFHDAQRHADTGIGKYTKTWTEADFAPGELDRIVEEHRAAQKAKNLAHKKFARAEADRALTAVENIRLPPQALPDIDVQRTLELRLDEGTGNSTVLLGSSKAGKSTTMMRIYRDNYARESQITTLFSCSPQAPVYEGDGKKAERLVHVTGYDPRLIRMARAINRGASNEYAFCFMIDDIIDQRQDKTLGELILTLRNSNISSVVCLQYSNLLAKMSRANVNNVLLFRFNSDEAIEVVIATYLKSHFRRLGVPIELMVEFYKRATDAHGFIYLHPSTGAISFHRLPQ